MMRSPAAVLLALDTSTRTVGVALYDGIRVINEATWTSQDYHTVELAPAVAESLRKADLNLDKVGAIAIAIGPGSFTGLRVGLALAKGIALARRIPLVGIPTMDVLATAQPPLTIPMVIVLRVGRGRLAVGWYEIIDGNWKLSKKVEVLSTEDLSQEIQAPVFVCGELSDEERILLVNKRDDMKAASPANCLRRPAFLAELAWKRWQIGEIDDSISLSPIYLHYNDSIPG
jgi:tRNA threonylcarbamoyladenosine biosynthesis protein TsaB